MVLNKDEIKKKLLLLERNVALLEKYREVPAGEFLTDYTIQGAAMHYLVECIEIVIDIGNHILAEEYAETPSSYSDVIKKLAIHAVIPEQFSQENQDMPKFRNRIIHIYGEIDIKQVYDNLQKAPQVLRHFTEYYVSFLKKHQ